MRAADFKMNFFIFHFQKNKILNKHHFVIFDLTMPNLEFYSRKQSETWTQLLCARTDLMEIIQNNKIMEITKLSTNREIKS